MVSGEEFSVTMGGRFCLAKLFAVSPHLLLVAAMVTSQGKSGSGLRRRVLSDYERTKSLLKFYDPMNYPMNKAVVWSTNLTPLFFRRPGKSPLKSAVYVLDLAVSKLPKEEEEEEEEEKARSSLSEDRSMKALLTHLVFKSLLRLSVFLQPFGGFAGPLATKFDKVYSFMALVLTGTEISPKAFGSRSGSRMLANSFGPTFYTAAKYIFGLGFCAFALSMFGVFLHLSGLAVFFTGEDATKIQLQIQSLLQLDKELIKNIEDLKKQVEVIPGIVALLTSIVETLKSSSK